MATTPQEAWPFEKPADKWNIRVTIEHGRERYEGDLHEVGPYKSQEEAAHDVDACYAEVAFDGLLLWNGSKDSRTRRRFGKILVNSSVLNFYAMYER